jgi:glutathione S-transferase
LRRVPTLICDDGVALVDSFAIIDWLDHEVGPDRALYPADGIARRNAMRVTALFCGMADKVVSLFYEKALHQATSEIWINRCETQIGDTLAQLERERAAQGTPWWGGGDMTHADIANACMLRHMAEAMPGMIDWSAIPALKAVCDRCEAIEVFQKISQPFIFSG